MDTNKQSLKENLLRVIAVLGLVAVLLLGAWGIIQLAFFISSVFSNTGGALSNVASQQAQETLALSLPSSVYAGSPATVSWTHAGGSGNYSYAISYSCISGLSFKAPVPTGATQAVPCNTPFNYVQAANSMKLTASYAGSADAQTTITVSATNLSTGAVTATAIGNLVVVPLSHKPAAQAAAPAAPAASGVAPQATYTASGRYTGLWGYPDLAVSITSAYSKGGRAAVQFVIQNIGTNVAPAGWSFNALLPIGGSYTYPGGPERALYPGDKIVFSMGYSGGTDYNYGGYPGYYPYPPVKNVTIVIDPYNQLPEITKVNNAATASYIAY